MRHTLTAFVSLLLLVASTRGDDRAQAIDLVKQAVRAHGGAALEKTQQVVRTASGVTSSFGRDLPFSDELVVALPDRLRLTITSGGVQKTRVVQVVKDDRGWVFAGGMVRDLGKERLGEMREEMYLLWLTTLVPLQGSEFTLTPLPEEKVNGKPVVGVKVSHKGHADVRLYFDRATSLLVRATRKASEGGTAFEQVYEFAEHKEFEGVFLPARITELRDGLRTTELGKVAYKFPRSVEASAFERP